MTKTIVVRSCYLLIILWIGVSIIPIIGINHHVIQLESYDENSGCRMSMISNYIICPSADDINENGLHRAIIQETGKAVPINEYNPGYMESYNKFKENRYSIITVFIILFIAIQVIAFVWWNDHYKWINIQVKSCWKDKDNSAQQSHENIEVKP